MNVKELKQSLEGVPEYFDIEIMLGHADFEPKTTAVATFGKCFTIHLYDESAEWTKDLPTESGSYWHWNGDEDSMPIHMEVMWSGTSNSCFAPAGQWGWNRPQELSEMGGWWMPMETPPPPQTDGLRVVKG